MLAQYYWDIIFESFEEAWKNVHSEFDKKVREGHILLRAGNLEGAREKLYEPWYRENIAGIAEELHISIPNQLIEKITRAFQDSWMGGLKMPEENRAVLEKLIEDGYQLGLVTNFQQPDIISDILANFKINGPELFKTTIISADIGVRKPHPDIFKSALQELNISETPPGQVIYVGDNLDEDVEGAKWLACIHLLIPKIGMILQNQLTCIKSIVDLPKILQG
jgi:HAD superfamily hydrolase (TIGR01549 family)